MQLRESWASHQDSKWRDIHHRHRPMFSDDHDHDVAHGRASGHRRPAVHCRGHRGQWSLYDQSNLDECHSPVGCHWSASWDDILLGSQSAIQDSHLSPRQQLMWVGIDLTMTNTGQSPIGLGETGGPGPPVIYFVATGSGISTNDISELSGSGFEMGVPGCPFPFPSTGLLNPGVSISGCVALAVPVGVEVSAVGFDLQLVSGRPDQQVAQWAV